MYSSTLPIRVRYRRSAASFTLLSSWFGARIEGASASSLAELAQRTDPARTHRIAFVRDQSLRVGRKAGAEPASRSAQRKRRRSRDGALIRPLQQSGDG